MTNALAFRRYIAPAGVPLGLERLIHAALDTRIEGLTPVAEYLDSEFIFGACSGRAALWLILESLKRLQPHRCVVAVPAYTCFSVAAAVARAGLKILPIDMDPETLELNYRQLEYVASEELLCILTANLFGYVNDVHRLEAIASAHNTFLVDDGAQALGASRDGRLAGTAGHVGFFSFARGKPLAAGEGGLIITRCKHIAQVLHEPAAALSSTTWLHDTGLFLKLLATSLLLDPKLYWIPKSLPFLKLGVTEYDPRFVITSLSRLSQNLIATGLGDLEKLNQHRAEIAERVKERLTGHPKMFVPEPALSCSPTFVRLPVVARDRGTRDRAVQELQRAGIGASVFYPSAICDIAAAEPLMLEKDSHRQGAEDLSRRLLTLPTHPLVSRKDLERMTSVLTEI